MSLTLPAATFTTYIPPTTPSLAQFTPAPTCYPTTAGEQLWHVTGICYPYAPHGNPKKVALPQCTYTRAGNPEENKPDCGYRWPWWGASGIDPATPIGSCPVGFTSAGLDDSYNQKKPFDRTLYSPIHTTISYDATASGILCCPSIDGLHFQARKTGNVYASTRTIHSGVLFEMLVPMPYCYAHPATALDAKTVTMGIYHDSRIYDKRKEKRQAWGEPGWEWGDQGETTTAVFNARRDTVWAEEVRYAYTVFHGTHTCYENCDSYFTNSYYNTDPNYTPPPATTTSSRPSGGWGVSGGGGGGWYYGDEPPYPTGGSGTTRDGAVYPRAGSGVTYPAGGGGQHQRGAPAPLPVLSEASLSGMRLGGGRAVLSTMAAGFFLTLTLAL